jgi:serine/threonine-protein kinase
MAPEQFNPHARLTAAVDIYALGMVAYTLLTGRSYWSAEAKAGGVFALAAVAALGPREPASVRAALRGVTLPPGFDAWFAKITAPDPAQRFDSAIEAVRALGFGPSFARAASGPPSAPGAAPAPRGDPATKPSLASLHAELPEATSLLAEPSQAALAGATMRPASFPTLSRVAAPPSRGRTKLLVGGGLVLAAGIAIGVGGGAARARLHAVSEIGYTTTDSALPAPANSPPPASAAASAEPPALSAIAPPASASASSRPPAVGVKPAPPRIPPPRKYTRD